MTPRTRIDDWFVLNNTNRSAAVVAQALGILILLCALPFAGRAHAQQVGATLFESEAAPITSTDLVQLRGLSGLAVSPNGEYAVVRVDRQLLEQNETLLHWQIVRLKSGDSWRLTDAGSPIWNLNGGLDLELPQWSDDGQWVYFRKLTGQEVQVWRASIDGLLLEKMTDDASDVLAFLINDGVLVYLIAGATREEIQLAEANEYDAGVLMDRTIIPGFPVVRSFPFHGRMTTYRRLLPAIMRFGRSTLLGDRPVQVRALRLDDRQIETPAQEPATRLVDWWDSSSGGLEPYDPRQQSAKRSTDSQKTAEVRLSQPSSETSGPATPRLNELRWQSGDGREAVCESPVCRAADRVALVGWADRDRIVFQTENFGEAGLHIWDTKSEDVRTLASGDRVFGTYALGTRGACQVAMQSVICLTSGPTLPPRLVEIDLGTGKERTLLNPNPDLTADRFGATETITLVDQFGNSTFGRLILPLSSSRSADAKEPIPLVITSYTCTGFLLGGSGWDVPEHVFSGLGYASLCLDLNADHVRRAPGYVATQERQNQSMLDFVEDAVRILGARGMIDRDRVALAGFSGSSSGATYALPRSKTITAAIITTTSAMDPINHYIGGLRSGLRGIFERSGYKPPYDSLSNAFFQENSAAWNADKIVAPLLMQLADVEYMSMMQLFTTMVDFGRGVEMHVFPDEYHFKRQPRHRVAVYERNVDWVNFWLRGAESPEPSREQQNVRWRAIKSNQCRLFERELSSSESPWYCRSH